MTQFMLPMNTFRDYLPKQLSDYVVLAFLFALPDTDAICSLDANGEYFDTRSGKTWDLFFPGYYKQDAASQAASDGSKLRPVGSNFAQDWYFSPTGFNALRDHIENASGGRWEFSGGPDLVLINAVVPVEGDIVVDWASTASGQLTDSRAGSQTLPLPAVVELISRDLEKGIGDDFYGVRDVVRPAEPSAERSEAMKNLFTSIIAGIVANCASKLF